MTISFEPETERHSYQKVLTAYNELEAAYHLQGREIPAVALTHDPEELYLVLQRMLHELKFAR